MSDIDHALFDGAEFAERQAAFVELAAVQAVLGHFADQAFDARGRGIDQRAAGAFHGVGQHQHGRLLGLRLGAGIAEAALVDFAAVGIGLLLLGGPVVEELHPRGAVVLRDQVDDRLRQAVLPGQVGAVLDVGDDHQRAHGGHQRLVAVVVGALVLDEIARLEHLADVVEIGPHADQQAAGVDASAAASAIEPTVTEWL